MFREKRFHGKFFAGISDNGTVECFLTSFNLIEAELNQLETFDLRILKEEDFKEKFLENLK